ncbi:Hypothetical_protein [Hexamita inflata]|uniref:Hypothetical_protein n=1 Tax=Hexamita inflata TaxID=28002 RepID=A0AA86TZL9_9EUKA|nr:Hypothetical protein HINF_LOCUS23700 [Hexamita inflata]
MNIAKQCLYDLTKSDIENISDTALIASILCLNERLYNRFLLEMSYHLNLPIILISAIMKEMSIKYLANPSNLNSSFNSNTRFSRNLEYIFPQVFLNVVEELTGARMNSIYGALTFQVQRDNKFFWKLVQKNISEYTEAQLKTYYYKLCELQTKGTNK